MTIKNISHIAVGVRDMDVALTFWTEVVGLHISLDTIEEFSMGGQVRHRRAVYLREREGADEPFIVLDQGLTTPYAGDPKPLFEIGMHHFGFWVDDLDAVHARARQASVPIILKPGVGDTAAYGEPSGGKVRTMFLRDPDGNAVQFDERA